MKSYKTLKKQLLKDKEIKREYELLEPEFKAIRPLPSCLGFREKVGDRDQVKACQRRLQIVTTINIDSNFAFKSPQNSIVELS